MMPLLLLLATTGTHAIQPPGTFHSGEAVARQGERWLALTAGDGQSRLTQTRLQVKTIVDEMLDGPGEATGQSVSPGSGQSVDGKAEVVAFIRGPLLRPGPVPQARVDDDSDGGRGQTLQFEGRRYRLETRCETTGNPDTTADVSAYRCRIELSLGDRRQTVIEMDGSRQHNAPGSPVMLGDDASPSLIFAGDLDRDGELDLIFDTSNHYNVSQPTLFLSGAAESDELLHAVAEYSSVGC